MTKEELIQAQVICKKYLDNADIFEISFDDDSILLKFTTGDEESFIEIQIECFQIQHFSITKDWDKKISEVHFVGETHIKHNDTPANISKTIESSGHYITKDFLPERIYKIEIDGGITIEIICVDVKLSFERQEDNNV